jgi:hypothetical protein
VQRREASKYVFIRENGLEWNDSQIVSQNGPCFGVDPCRYDIEDNVKVLYFDNQMFDRITDRTRCCNEMRTCLLGGKGQRIRIDSLFCCGICVRSAFPCVCGVPVCCPLMLCPCALAYHIYVDDAKKAIEEVATARASAKERMGVN